MGLLNFKNCGLSEIIRNKMYIPKYQRSYAWEKNEYTDLWEDLKYLVDSNNDMHFYGQIVVHRDTNDSGKLFIIDGQQRITTAFFLIRAFLDGYNLIYNKYKDKNSPEAKKLVRHIIEIEQLIGFDSNESYSSQDLHLVQNEIDNDYFVKLMCLNEEVIKGKPVSKSSTYRMKAAYSYFHSQIVALIKDCVDIPTKYEKLEKYYKKFTEQFKVMYLEDDNLAEAYTIFETLNDRGKDLASTDLLKNYILANTDTDASYKKWNLIVTNLDNVDITKYIRSVWNSGHSFAREKALYSSIAGDIKRNSLKCNKFLDELVDCSLFYHDIVEPSNAKTITNASLKDALIGLKTMSSSTWHPILLAIHCKKDAFGKKQYSADDEAKVAKALESYVFRNFLICSSNPNEAEIQFANLATSISAENLDCAVIVKTIKDGIVKDSQFDLMFKDYTFKETDKDKEKIRYFFRKIHKHLDKVNEINLDNSEVHIEHIMPEKYEAHWPQCKDYHDEYLWKIGNLCLLSGPLNIEISNKDFSFKKENAYKQSQIKPNDELLKYTKWDKDEIQKRQIDLLALAKKIW